MPETIYNLHGVYITDYIIKEESADILCLYFHKAFEKVPHTTRKAHHTQIIPIWYR